MVDTYELLSLMIMSSGLVISFIGIIIAIVTMSNKK